MTTEDAGHEQQEGAEKELLLSFIFFCCIYSLHFCLQLKTMTSITSCLNTGRLVDRLFRFEWSSGHKTLLQLQFPCLL